MILESLVAEARRLVAPPGRAMGSSRFEMRVLHPLQNVYWSMRGRCRNKNDPNYKRYGGRGIYVCDRWLEAKNGFRNFCADMGDRPPGLTLDRIDNDGPYSPENCRWATSNQQYRNRRSNVWITHNGETKIKADWSRDAGGHYGLVNVRERNGTLQRAVAKHAENKRSETHCKRGHEFTESNTALVANAKRNPVRRCRTCSRAWDKYLYYGKARQFADILKEYENVL